MAGKVKTTFVRIVGWVLLIGGLIMVLSIIFGDDFDLFVLIFFIVLTFVGLGLTGYGRKKPAASAAPEKVGHETTPSRELVPIKAELPESNEDLLEDQAYCEVMKKHNSEKSMLV